MISNITLQELEDIKISPSKDAEIKYKARQVIKKINEDNDEKCHICSYLSSYEDTLNKAIFLPKTADSRIIITAKQMSKIYPDLTFKTDDICCKQLAKEYGLAVEYKLKDEATDYKGFKEVFLSDEDLAIFYKNLSENKQNN